MLYAVLWVLADKPTTAQVAGLVALYAVITVAYSHRSLPIRPTFAMSWILGMCLNR